MADLSWWIGVGVLALAVLVNLFHRGEAVQKEVMFWGTLLSGMIIVLGWQVSQNETSVYVQTKGEWQEVCKDLTVS